MNRTLLYFRAGEEARMLARLQFGLGDDGRCGATFTYPIKGYPWRKNVMRGYPFDLSKETIDLMFSEVRRIKRDYPEECLESEQLWSDRSEKANSITRDRATGKLCCYIGVFQPNHELDEFYYLREDSTALLNSEFYKVISTLVTPYEKL